MTDPLAKGLAAREKMFGHERTQAAFDNADDVGRDFQELMTAYCFGEVWGREGVAWRDRSLMTMCILAGQHRFSEFETHMRLAIRNGCDKALIGEMVRHIAVYCGVPSGGEAARIAQRVLAETEAGNG